MRLPTIVIFFVFVLSCAAAKPQMTPKLAEKSIDIESFTDEDIQPVMKKFDERVMLEDKIITFRIHSNGGSVESGMQLIQHIEDVKKLNGIMTVCIADYKAFSMGAAFLESEACDQRLMTKRSTLLFHGASVQVGGNVDDLESVLIRLKALNRALGEMCASRMNISYKEYAKKTQHNDWFMSWDEALRIKAVDGIIDPELIPPPYDLDKPVQKIFLLPL